MRIARGLAWTAVALAVVYGAVFGAWSLLFPGPNDLKCPRYVLWKWHLYPFDPDVVYGSMVLEKYFDADRLVVGLTLGELESRFGRLRTRADCTESQRYYSEHEFLGREIRWLGDSQWLVVIESGRVKELHLEKG
jgi:hypothetical protein